MTDVICGRWSTYNFFCQREQTCDSWYFLVLLGLSPENFSPTPLTTETETTPYGKNIPVQIYLRHLAAPAC